MGKNLFRRLLAFLVMFFGAVTVFSACAKDPYKKMRLSLDKSEVSVTLDDESDNTFSITATVSGVGKNVSKDVRFVIGDNSVVSPVSSDYIKVNGNNTTATFVASQNGGMTYIDVLTLEGGCKERVMVNVVIPVKAMQFAMNTLPIERGVKTDITSKFDGVSTQIYDRITYTPSNTTQKDVTLKAYIGGVEATSEQIVIDGNYVTVLANIDTFVLSATNSANESLTTQVQCVVLDTINLENIKLVSVAGTAEPEDLYTTFENGNKVYNVNLANNGTENSRKEISPALVGDGDFAELYTFDYVATDKVRPFRVGQGTSANSFVIDQGYGHNSDTVEVKLNYKNYENLFAPKYVTVRVNVSTFPDKIQFTNESGLTDKVRVYRNYANSVEGATAILNILYGESVIGGQSVKLRVEANGTEITNGIKLWYYSGGVKHDIDANTLVKHGTKVYIGYDYNALGEYVNSSNIKLIATSTVNDTLGELSLDLVKGIVAPNLVNLTNNTISIEIGQSFELGLAESEKTYLILGDEKVSLSECMVRLQKGNGDIVSANYDADKNVWVFDTKGVVGSTKCEIFTPNGCKTQFDIVVYEKYTADTLAFRIGNKFYTLADNNDDLLDENKLTMPSSSSFGIKLVKLLDGATIDEGVVDGKYEILQSMPSNLSFGEVKIDGSVVVVDYNDPLIVRSSRSVGQTTIEYVLISKSFDGSQPTNLYINFDITVEARLNDFVVKNNVGQVSKSFSIITRNSLNYPSGYDDLIYASLTAFAYPENVELEIENLDFEVRYQDYMVTLNRDDADDDGNYYYGTSARDFNGKLSFGITVKIEDNQIKMIFSSLNLDDVDSANINITLVYKQMFLDIDGNEMTLSNRNTNISCTISNSVKTTAVNFEKNKIDINVNQLNLDGTGKVQNEERAKTSIAFTITASGNKPASAITVKGFYLFFTDNAHLEYTQGAEILDSDDKVVPNNYLICDNNIKVVVDEENNRVYLEILKWTDNLNNVNLYLVPKDLAFDDGKGNLIFSKDSVHIASNPISAKLSINFCDGTETNPYIIKDAYDLQFVNYALNSYYKIVNNIILNESVNWTPIGKNSDYPFNGHIVTEGNQTFVIAGLRINKEVEWADVKESGETKRYTDSDDNTITSKGYVAYYGLFGYIGKKAEISNIRLENVQIDILYNGDRVNERITSADDQKHFDVYLGAFAGLNLGKLTNITVIDNTVRGYDTLKGNVLDTLIQKDVHDNKQNSIAYQPTGIVKAQSNHAYIGGVVGVNGGYISTLKVNIALFVRDKQEHPTLNGITTTFVGGVAGVNIASNLGQDNSGTIDNADVYSLINATLVDNIYKGMIRNDYSVVGGVVGLNESSAFSENTSTGLGTNYYLSKITNITCTTIIIANNYVGGIAGYNYGLIDEVKVNPHIIANDYVGGIAGVSANLSTISATNVSGTNTNILNNRLSLNGNGALADTTANSNYSRGIIYHSKVQFVDRLDDISFFNSSIIARNYVGGIAGYVLENNVQDVTISNVPRVSRATLTSTSSGNVVATIGYSSVNSYFVVSNTSIEKKRQSIVSIDANEAKYLNQLYMSFDHKDNMGQIDFDKNLLRDNTGVYYGDIIILNPLVVNSIDKNTYVGGIVGLSDGDYDNSNSILTGFGSALINVYFNATITNTYAEKDGSVLVGTATIGGVVGKANGLLFVFNANILGQTKNATNVGGFVGDSTGLLDRLAYEDRLPYEKNDYGYYVKSDKLNDGYSGAFNINNSYTLLKSDGQYVQNFAYLGEVVEKKTVSGNTGDTGQVSSVEYNIFNFGSAYQSNAHYYYVERNANNVSINYYADNTVKSYTSKNPIEKRKILKFVRNEDIIIQTRENGSFLYKDSAVEPAYSEDSTGLVDAEIFKLNGLETYFKKQIDINGTVSYVVVETNSYSPLYVASADKANMPKYYTANEVKAKGEDVNTTLVGDGILKYRPTEYYRATNIDSENYFTDNAGTTPITVYTADLLYVEQVPVYTKVKAEVYTNGKYNNGNEFYLLNDYIYSNTGKTVSGINANYDTVSGTLFERGESKSKTGLAAESIYTDFKIGDTVYDKIEIENGKIKFTKSGTTGITEIQFDSKNMYHNLIKYAVDGTEPQNNTALGVAIVTFNYTRLTASNSYYVGFKTDRYDVDGNKSEITFDKDNVNESDYYSSAYHYTNIKYSDLIFENYDNIESLAGWYIKYIDNTENAFVIPEYVSKSALVKGEGFVNPLKYIKGYTGEGGSRASYTYSLYEGSGDTGLGDTKPNGEFLYRNNEINHGVPLSFGRYMDAEHNSTLDLIIDLAPETLNAIQKETIYKVDNVKKDGAGFVEDTSSSRPISLMLDWDSVNSEFNNTYTLIGTNAIVDISVLPKFVGNGSLVVRSSDDRIVKIVKSEDEYKLVTLGVGSAIITITSSLNNSLCCDIVVMVKEAVNTLTYNYTTTSGFIDIDSTASVLKNNSSIFGLLGANGENPVVLQNIWLEYKISGANKVVVDGKTYNTANAICIEGASHNFKVTSDFSVQVRPFYLYSVNYKGTNYLYRKYVDALTGRSELSSEFKTYNVTQTSYAYNIYAPNNISSGIASMSSFEIIVKSNDEILVPVKMEFACKNVVSSHDISSTLSGGIYTSKFDNGTDTITVNYLTFVIVETKYNSTRNEHTIKFVAYVDPSDYENVTNKTTFEITCSIGDTADRVERKDKFSYTILPFQVENVRLSHYTKFYLNENVENVDYQNEYKSYKYASTKIVPGYNSLLQADITPSYGKFDYVVAEIEGTPDSVISQVVESQAYQNDNSGVSVYYNYPFFEKINNASNIIKVSNKYSVFNDGTKSSKKPYDETDTSSFVWNGSLLFALSLDSKYSDSTVKVTIKGYAIEDGGDTLQFEQSITLDVVGVPQVAITWDNSANDCYSTTNSTKTDATLNVGGTLPINFIAQNYDKIESWSVENNLGEVLYNISSGKYEFVLNGVTADNYANCINKMISLTCTVSRIIDGVSYLSSSTVRVQIVDFLVRSLTFLDATAGTSEDMMSIYYNDTKDIIIKVDALYDENALLKIDQNKVSNVENAIDALGKTITNSYTLSDDIYVAVYLWKNAVKGQNNLISTGDYSRRGYILGAKPDANSDFANFTIKIAESSIGDKFITEVLFDYTSNGVQIVKENAVSSLGVLKTKTLVVNVMQLSTDNNPFPIKSINDFTNMAAGESYILLNDLVLSKWTPIPALFKSFDGNGYTITITSFGDVAGLTNIGLFSEIGADDDLGYYTTVKNLTIDICPVVEDVNGALSIDNTGVLEVSIENTEGVNAGILAGTNHGIITNVNIINNAMYVRKNRIASLNVEKEYDPIITEDFSKYFDGITTGTINIDSDNHVDTFSIAIDNTKDTLGLRVGGLVGLNSSRGYITNSSVERINVKGIDYVAGFVAQNSGYISSSYYKAGSVISNDKQTKANSSTAGFVASHESGKIQFCYVLGDETVDVFDKNEVVNNINKLTTFIDSTNDMLVINSNSPESNSSDNKTGPIKIDLREYAGYQLYKKGYEDDNYKKFVSLRALGSAVYTNSYASGFVGINKATVSNCYANILVSGTNGAGFAYDNSGSIESSYSMSSIINENTNYYPFVATKTSVDKSFYMYIAASDSVDSINGISVKDSFSKATEDVATSLYAGAFGDYNTFTSWGFNSDYANNNNIEDGVWFIPNDKTTTTQGYKDHLKQSTYTAYRPELITANMRTISLRYYVSAKNVNGKDRYEYKRVNNWEIVYDIDNNKVSEGYNIEISQGTTNNPVLISTAQEYNINLGVGSTTTINASVVRLIHDIAFDQIQTAKTFSTDFIGNFEGNGLSIDQLRISADDINSSDKKITYLGLFKSIRKISETKKGNAVQTTGTVRNLKINIEEINGSNINFVGVLAGVIDGGKVYNINVYGKDKSIKVEGLNAVGGLAGLIVGDADVVNVTSNISVQANSINKFNTFSSKNPNKANTDFKMFVSPFEEKTSYLSNAMGTEDTLYNAIENISYVGGIAGIIDVCENPKNSTAAGNTSIDFVDRIRQCYVGQSIALSGEVVGGLAGYVGSKSNVTNSEFVVIDTTEINALRVCGAIVGHNEGRINRTEVKYYNQNEIDAKFYKSDDVSKNNSDYYNTLDNPSSNDAIYTLQVKNDLFTGNAHYIGGVVGANIGGTIENSYSRVNVINENSAYAGGVIGLNVGGKLDSIYTTGSVYGFFGTGGIIGIQPAIYGDENNKKFEDASTSVGKNSTFSYISNSDALIKALKNDNISTTYSNIVGANMWRRVDINPTRSQYYPTQSNSWVGMFVGYLSNKDLIKQNSIQSRKIYEDTFFKATYKYLQPNVLLDEIGNMNSISFVDKTVKFEDSTKEKLVIAVSNEENTYTMISGDHTSGDYTYRYSRLRYFGSLRTLNELVGRGYNLADANAVWTRVTSSSKDEGDTTNKIVTRVYYGWDTFNWNGTLLNASGEIVNEVQGVRDVFPSIVNNLKPKLVNVYTEDDLRKMRIYLDATFVLQNDINLTTVWQPVGTESKPFTGKLYSAPGKKYSINTLTIDDSGNDYFGFVRVADGAEFKNFNLNSSTIKCNTDVDDKAQSSKFTKAGAIFIGLAKNCTVNDISFGFTDASSTKASPAVYINHTSYVGGVIGLSGTNDSDGNSVNNLSLGKNNDSTSDATRFVTSMYMDSNSNYEYAFGGIIGKNNAPKELSGLTVNNLKIEVSASAEQNKNATFNSNNICVGAVFGYSASESDLTARTLTTNNIDLDIVTAEKTNVIYVGGVVGYSSGIDYSSITSSGKLIVNNHNSIAGTSSNNVGGTFGYVYDSKLKSITATQDIKYTGNKTGDRLFIGGIAGRIYNVEIDVPTDGTVAISSTTKSYIDLSVQENSILRIGGAVGSAENSTINNVNVYRYTGNNGQEFKKLDIIKITDKAGTSVTETIIYAGGLVGYADSTAVTTSNAIGNINHSKNSESTANIYSAYQAYMGGAIGYAVSEGYADSEKISKVSADVDIIDDRFVGNDKTFAYGGLAGFVENIDISNSYAVGKIYSAQHIMYISQDNTVLGGLVGEYKHTSSEKTIENCYSAVEFVLPNSDDIYMMGPRETVPLINYSYDFLENTTQKGGILGTYKNESGKDDISIINTLYVKEFVPFSNGYGTAVCAEYLKTQFGSVADFVSEETEFYPRLTTAESISGSGQNPLTTLSVGEIKSGNTVYIKNDGYLLDSLEIDKRASLVLLGNATSNNETITITNNGTIYGGTIDKTITITNNGSMIGLRTYDVAISDNIAVSAGISTTNKITLDKESSGFAYASMFTVGSDIILGDIANSIIVGTGKTYTYSKNYKRENLTVLSGTYSYHLTDESIKEYKRNQARNVDNFDSLSLDINKYWGMIANENAGVLVPSWIYKEHYFDRDYASKYSWIDEGKNLQVAPTEKSGVYEITTAQQLAWVAYQVNEVGNSFAGKTIQLMNTIDLAGKLWTPIGFDENRYFAGTFDGNGNTILGMTVCGNKNNGLFGVVNGATIQNLLIENAQVASGTQNNTAILIGATNSANPVTISKVGIENSHLCGGNTAGFVGNADSGAKIDISNAYAVVGITAANEIKHYNNANGKFYFIAYNNTAFDNTIKNVYGAEIKYDETSNDYKIESSTFIPSSSTTEKYGYTMISYNSNDYEIKNTYVVNDEANWSSTYGGTNKKYADMQTQTKALFDNWGSVWNRIEGKNYNLPRLTFSQEYWIDEGKNLQVAPTEKSGVYEITTAQQLAWVAYQVNEVGNSFAGKTIKLANEIDLAGKLWTPIGVRIKNLDNTYTDRAFEGSFVSGGTSNYIKNMTCYGAYSSNRPKVINLDNSVDDYEKGYDSEYGGLFGVVNDSPIMNVDAIGNFVVDRTNYAGAFIAKYIMSENMLKDSTITVGFLGQDSTKYIVNGTTSAGGIVGHIENTNSDINVKIIYTNVNNVEVSSNGDAGGIVGYAQKVQIVNSAVGLINDGSVVVNGRNAGGVVGNVENINIDNVVVSKVSVNGTENAGGIAGLLNNGIVFDSSVANSTINENEGQYAGGVVGQALNTVLSALKVEDTTVKGKIVGGLAGSMTGNGGTSILQNATVINATLLTTTSNESYLGGIVGKLSNTDLSEISYKNTIEVKTGANKGLVCGKYENCRFCNFYFDINIGTFIGNNTEEFLFENYLFGADLDDNNKDCMISILYKCKIFSLSTQSVKYINIDAIKESSAWDSVKNSIEGDMPSELTYYMLKSNGNVLKSNYVMENRDVVLSDINKGLISYKSSGNKVIITPFDITPNEKTYFFVCSQEEFKYVREYQVYRNNYKYIRLALGDDLDITSDYEAIGSENIPFNGSLDGGDYTISVTGKIDTQGLFGYASRLDVYDLTLSQKGTDSNNIPVEKSTEYGFVTSSTGYVGGIVGRLVTSSSSFKNITSYIDVMGGNYVGGLIGYASGSLTIEGCNVYTYMSPSNAWEVNGLVSKVSGQNYVGGLIGYADGASTDSIKIVGKSTTENNVTTITPFEVQKQVVGSEYVGGVVGYGIGVSIKSGASYTFLNSKNEVQFSVYSENASGSTNLGGFVGYAENSLLDSCNAYGVSVSSKEYKKASCVGGFVGYAKDSTINNCKYVDSALPSEVVSICVAGIENIGGILGKGLNTNISNCESSSKLVINSIKIGIELNFLGNWKENDIYTGSSNVGGIVGYLQNENNVATITNCTNKADMIGLSYIGGIAGEIQTSGNVITINSCNNYGCINKYYLLYDRVIEFVGGIAGYITNSTQLTNNVVSGKAERVSITGHKYVGGLFGYGYTSSSAKYTLTNNTIQNVDILGIDEYIGGIGGEAKKHEIVQTRYYCQYCHNEFITKISHHCNLAPTGASVVLIVNKTSKYYLGLNDAGTSISNTKITYNGISDDDDEGWFIKSQRNNYGDKEVYIKELMDLVKEGKRRSEWSDGDNYTGEYKTINGNTRRYSRGFNNGNVLKNNDNNFGYNVWFGPTDGTANTSGGDSKYYTTMGCTNVLYKGDSDYRKLPYLQTTTGIENFFSSAMGYNNKTFKESVGLLYGFEPLSQSTTALSIDEECSITYGNSFLDRFTHWFYIETGGYCGVMVIQWTYGMDKNQLIPTSYNFITDTQKNSMHTIQNRIGIKYYYKIVAGTVENLTLPNYNYFIINNNDFYTVAEPFRNIKDLLCPNANSIGGNNAKGLINQFVLSVYYKKATMQDLYIWQTDQDGKKYLKGYEESQGGNDCKFFSGNFKSNDNEDHMYINFGRGDCIQQIDNRTRFICSSNDNYPAYFNFYII